MYLKYGYTYMKKLQFSNMASVTIATFIKKKHDGEHFYRPARGQKRAYQYDSKFTKKYHIRIHYYRLTVATRQSF